MPAQPKIVIPSLHPGQSRAPGSAASVLDGGCRGAERRARVERRPAPRDDPASIARRVLAAREFEAFLQRERDLADRGTRCVSLVSLGVSGATPRSRAGITALAALACEARHRLRSTDLVGWLGEERLGILLVDTEPPGTAVVLERVKGVAAQLATVLDVLIYTYPYSPEPGGKPAAPERPAGGRAGRVDLSPAPPVADLGEVFNIPTPACKRAVDIVVAAAALLVLLPLFGLIALAIRLDSPGPVIFRQSRAGLGGRPFTFYKFRSMIADAEARRAALADQNEQNGPVFKIRADPRVTRVGRLLRRWSLDELPQLWNVLRGDLSLVGPRSPTLEEVARYDRWQRRRLSVVGGITCTWQVSGRSQIPFREWMRLDLRYVARRSLWLDLWLLARTLPAVISGRGAY